MVRDEELSSMKMAVFGDEMGNMGGSSSKWRDFEDEEGRLWGSSTELGVFEDEIPSGRGPAAISGEGALQSFEILQPTT